MTQSKRNFTEDQRMCKKAPMWDARYLTQVTDDISAVFYEEARTGWPAALAEISHLQQQHVVDTVEKVRLERERRETAEDALRDMLALVDGGYLTRKKMSAAVDGALRKAREALKWTE